MVKVLKIIATILTSIVVVAVVCLAVAINFVFTPEKLTKTVNVLLSQYFDSLASVSNIELTFFSTFPNFTLEIDSLSIAQTSDSIPRFVEAPKCRVTINPVVLLTSNEVKVKQLLLNKPSIYLFADSTSNSLNVFNSLIGDTKEKAKDSIAISRDSDLKISIDEIRIDSANFVIDDRNKGLYAKMTNYVLTLKGDLNSRHVDLNVLTRWDNLLVWLDNRLIANELTVKLSSEMSFSKDSLLLRINNGTIDINNISLRVNGSLRGDTIDKSLDVDLLSSLSTPSLAEFLNLIPSTIIDKNEEIKTKGSVVLNVGVNGVLSSKSLPTLLARLSVENAAAKYASRKESLDRVDCKATLYVDFNNADSSYFDIDNLFVETMGIVNVNLKVKSRNLLRNPHVDASLKSHINFNRLTEIFPLQPGVTFKGENNTDISSRFYLSDIQKSNYANIMVNGESNFKNLILSVDGNIVNPGGSNTFLFVEMQKGQLLFGDKYHNRVIAGTTNLSSSVEFSGIGFKDELHRYVLAKNVELSLGANINKKDGSINGVGGLVSLQGVALGVEDSVDVRMKSANLTVKIIPAKENRALSLESIIKSDSIYIKENINNSRLNMSQAGISIVLSRRLDNRWSVAGEVGFEQFKLLTDIFPLQINIPSTSVALNDETISLNSAILNMGTSTVVATGYVKNVVPILFGQSEKKLSGLLNISSKSVNLNEIIEASNKGVEFYAMGDSLQKPDSNLNVREEDSQIGTSMVLVPKNMNLSLILNIESMRYETLQLDSLRGKAVINDGVFSVNNLGLYAIGAKAESSIVYKNINEKESQLFLNLDINKVDITRIGELIPAIDSMLPMMGSFEGVIDFSFRANSKLDDDMSFDIPSMKAALAIDGRDLVLLDSKTFKKISKLLMFKNKQRNVIDSIGVRAIVRDSEIQVFPFEAQLDRYRAIVGGMQTIKPNVGSFDIDYKYNISIMKSPLPFKAGVDIYGNMEDLNFKITKAKLKNSDFEMLGDSYEKFRSSIKE